MKCPDTPASIIKNLAPENNLMLIQKSWSRFYDIYLMTVKAMAVKSFKKAGWHKVSENDITDVVQNAFISLFTAFKEGSYTPENHRFRGFLKRIVERRTLDFIRASRKNKTISIDALETLDALEKSRQDCDYSYFDNLEESEMAEYRKAILNEATENVLQDCAPTMRLSFELRAMRDVPMEEVCRQLDISPARASKNVFTITQRLKSEINKPFYKRELQK